MTVRAKDDATLGDKTWGDKTWVGRSIRRVEDPSLVVGQGRFTGDLPAALWVRFVRSSVASGRIARITAPDGITVVTAADLATVKPHPPMPPKVKFRANHPAGAGGRRRAFRRRADCGSGRRQQGGG